MTAISLSDIYLKHSETVIFTIRKVDLRTFISDALFLPRFIINALYKNLLIL